MKHEERLLEQFKGKQINPDYQANGYKVLDLYDCDFSVSCNDREIIILLPEPEEDDMLEASVHLENWRVSDIEIERLNPHRSERIGKSIERILRELLTACLVPET